ncbi:MAG TPA: M36 family metallopeptidase [Humisphaera sp.]|jgi:uncharacterized delta-60 repeat protein|nr:M36 family metallopeptidase [Humisphaera sp.]
MGSFRRRPPRPPLRTDALRAAAHSIAERLEARVFLSANNSGPIAPYVPPGHNLAATSGLLSPPAAGAPLDVAMAYLRAHVSDLGITTADLSSPLVTNQYTDSDTGETHIYLQQRIGALAVEDADISISLTRDNQVITAASNFIANAAGLISTAHTSAQGALTASQALVDAAPDLGLDLNAAPSVATESQSAPAITVGPSTITTLVSPDASLDPIPAKQVYIPTPTGLRLGWDMLLRTPDGEHWYDARIDGHTGALLGAVDFAHPLLPDDGSAGSAAPAADTPSDDSSPASDLTNSTESYDVYPLPLKNPDDGSRQIVTNPADPTFSPFGWLDTNGQAGADSTTTSGNNVDAYIDAVNTNLPSFQPDGGPSLSFDSPLDLSQNPASYMSAAVTQLFYLTNSVHDIYAHYGFTEAAGNFQNINYSGQGIGGDALQAQSQDGGDVDNSNFFTPPDGQSPIMQMYLWDKTSPQRDADFDSTVVIHEYTHGLTTRLTGGAASSSGLETLQSSGLAEGWSDWFALMLTEKPTDAADGAYGVGNYILGQGPGGPGVRQNPYSFDMGIDPLTFADFGTSAGVEAHSVGTIWGSALWDLNRLLIQKYGYSPSISQGYNAAVPGENGGNNLAIKLVMDALKLQPTSPSFTDARDAILAADRALDGGKNALEIWTAFARRGLGFSAVDDSPVSKSLTPAFDLPPGLRGTRVVAQTPSGTSTAPVGSINLTFNAAMDPTSFSIANDVVSFTDPGNSDLRSQISGFSWLNGNTTLEIDFTPPTVNGQYAMTLAPFILTAGSEAPLDQNLNGISGEFPADNYAATFGYTSNQLAVTTASPAAGAIVAMPMTTLDVTFSGPVSPNSIDPFVLVPSRGSIVSASLLNATTVRYQLAGLNSEGPLTITLPTGAVKDADGNDSAAFSESLAVDIVSTPFPSPFFAEIPAAPLIWERTTTGTIAPAGDSDSFTLNLDAGQTLSALVSAADGSELRPKIDLLDGSNQLIASASAGAAGQPAILQTGAIVTGGIYTLRVSSLAGTLGNYSIRAILNAAVVTQNAGGPAGNSIAAAQNINGSFVSLGKGATRGTVLGQLDENGTVIAADDFSQGTLGPAWSTFSSDAQLGEVFLQTVANHNYLVMDHNDPTGSTFNLNEAIWTVDLSGRSQATLTFQQTSFGDEQEAIPADFTGHFDGDGVSISDDNVHWHRVWDGQTADMQGLLGTVSINLAAAAAQAGMNLGPNFKIKFQQYDNYPTPIDGRAYADVRIISPDSPGDFYSFSATAGDSISAQVVGQDVSGGEQLSLYDPAGNLLAAGVSGASNADVMINDLIAPTNGTYYARVWGDNGAHYLLTIARDAELQTQPNDATPPPLHSIAMNGKRMVLGHFDRGASANRYSIYLAAGQTISLATATPGDGAGEPVNLLATRLRLLDPSASLAANGTVAADGRNSLLTFTPTQPGIYTIEIDTLANSPGGDYVLSVTGGTPAPTELAATITYPADGRLLNILSKIDIALSQPVLFSTVLPGALTVDGIAAASVRMLDGQTLEFVPAQALADGPHAIALAAGAFRDLYGDPVGAASSSIVIQSGGPRILTSSIVEGATVPQGDLTVTITFSRPMTTAGLNTSAIALFGSLQNTTVFPGNFGFDASGTVLTATFTNVPDDNYTLTLTSGAGGFQDAAGNALDGEPHWPLGPTGSGDGNPGGDFFVDFTVDTINGHFPTPLQKQPPVGSLVYTGTTGSAINTPGDIDPYAITLAAGESITAIVQPTSNWQPRITILGPNGATMGTALSSGDGTDVILESVFAPVSGTYTLVVASADAAGLYSLQVALNALVETELLGVSNDTPASAQPLDGGFIPIDPFRSADRVAVLGTTDATSGRPDFYSMKLQAGDHATIAVTSITSGAMTLLLEDADGHLLAIGSPDQASSGFAAAVNDFVAPASGEYVIEVIGPPRNFYNLQVVRNARFATGPNGLPATAVDLSSVGIAVGNVGGSLDDSFDFYSVAASAGNVLMIRTDTPGGPPGEFESFLDPKLTLFDSTGKVITSDDNSGPDRRNAEIVYIVPAGGSGVYYIRIEASRGSGEYSLVVDGASAPPLGAPDLLPATDSGISSNDDVTNFNNSSTARALKFTVPNTTAGASVDLFANGIQIGHATAIGTSTTISTDGKTALPDGIYNIIARQTIGANTLPDSPALQIRILTHAPPAPGAPTLDPSSDKGISSTDNLTSVASPLVDIPTPLFWRMFRNGTLIGSTAHGATFKSAALATGVYKFAVQAVDIAGNISALGSPLTITMDATLPKAIAVSAPPITVPGGKTYDFSVTFGDNIAVDATSLGDKDVIVTGPFGFRQSAKLISVSVNGASVTGHYQIAAPLSGWTGVFSGTYTIALQAAQVLDTAGNAAAAANVGTFKVSLPIVTPPAPVLAAASDRGISDTDDLTNLNNSTPAAALQFVVFDTAAGGTVSVYSDGILIGSTIAKGTTTTVTTNGKTKLLNGAHNITARITPPGGTPTAPSAPLRIRILHLDIAAPPPPMLEAASDSGISDHDGITNIVRPVFDVTAPSYYRVTANGKALGNGFILGNHFNTDDLPDGAFDLRLISQDIAGNKSAPSRPLHIVIDTKPPRIVPPGALDTSFGKFGVATTAAAGNDQIIAQAIQPDGKILVAGLGVNPANSATMIKLARFTRAGVLDNTFGTKGIAYISLATTGSFAFNTIAIQPDGRILLGGTVAGRFAVTRLLSNGTLDSSFANQGHALISLPAGNSALNALLLQSDGEIIAAGQIAGNFGMLRLSSAGALDKTFGIVVTQFPGASSSIASVAFTAGNRIIAGGTTSGGVFALARYSGGGVLDLSFGLSGLVTTFAGFSPQARRLVIQPDGKILLAGTIGNRQTFIGVARYNADGSADMTFGAGGFAQQALAGNAIVTDMLLDSNGRIVVAGNEQNAAGLQGFVFCFVSNGRPDPQFGTDGAALVALADTTFTAGALSRQSDGNYIVGGSMPGKDANADFALVRILGSGTTLTLDPSTDTGSNNTDGITNTAAPIYDLLGRGSSFYRIYVDGALFSGSYETAAKLALPAQGIVTFTLVDAAGNESAPMSASPVLFDSFPPFVEQFTTNTFVSSATNACFIRVTYDDSALDDSTFDGGDLLLIGPDGSSVSAQVVSPSTLLSQRSVVLYRFTPPGGAFDGTNNGIYNIWLAANQVGDLAGNVMAMQRVVSILVDIT